MRHLVRQIIRSRPLLYKLWLQMRNGYKIKLPDNDTDLHVDGFQRSGNSYAGLVLRNLYSNRRIVTNLHAIASLRQAIKYDVPTIILLRNPEQAILSSLVRRVDGEKEKLRTALSFDLHGYLDYYKFVRQNQSRFRFVIFEKMIADPTHLALIASEMLKAPKPSVLAINDAASCALSTLASDERYGANRNLYSGYKEFLKKKYLKYLDQKALKECNEIYESIASLGN